MVSEKKRVMKELMQVPGVGKSISEDLWDMGIRKVADLKGQSPDELYDRLCSLMGVKVDRCMLYVFRCAVYFASTEKHDPELLKWWNWKD